MPALALTFGPNPVFSKTAHPVTTFDDKLARLAQNMVDTLYVEKAVGIGANMVGVLQRIIVIDLQEGSKPDPQIFINPDITERSEETQSFEEASICFPGISAPITRPQSVSLTYQDVKGARHSLTAEGYLATVLQHELDYLNGVIFLDYLSAVKRKMLIKKTRKHQKQAGLS